MTHALLGTLIGVVEMQRERHPETPRVLARCQAEAEGEFPSLSLAVIPPTLVACDAGVAQAVGV